MVGKKLATIAAMVAALAATACDTWSGVAHQARLPARPDFQCVSRVVAADDAVTAIPVVRESEVVRIAYTVKATGNYVNLYFNEQRSPTETDFHHAFGVLNSYYSQDDVDIEWPIMMSIEQKIEQSCGITGLRNSVSEYCLDVACPSNDPEPGK